MSLLRKAGNEHRALFGSLRILRKPDALAALFPTVQDDVLGAALTHAEKWWYASELACFWGPLRRASCATGGSIVDDIIAVVDFAGIIVDIEALVANGCLL